MIEHATTFNRVLGDFLARAELAHRARQRRPESGRHLRAVPNAS